jgi:hypothetical protein
MQVKRLKNGSPPESWRRVAPVSGCNPHHNQGAPGPSLLGTGEEESNCRPVIHISNLRCVLRLNNEPGDTRQPVFTDKLLVKQEGPQNP